jgi:peptidoglycan/LPS O-acetylase OafA/YrhL
MGPPGTGHATRRDADPLPAARGAGPDGSAGVNLRLPALTGLRGVAAGCVFIRHVYADVQDAVPALAVLGNIGYAGVTFFFVLSGFVLAWTTGPGTAAQFYWRRFARIYPLYFVAVWVWLAVAWCFGLLGEFGSKTIAIVPSLLLVQAWVPDQSIYFGWGGAVLWSLSCEAFFYLAFPFVYRRLAGRGNAGRLRAAMLVVAPTAMVACVAGVIDSRVDLAAYANPGLRIGEFVLGVALGLMARSGARGTRGQRRTLAASACLSLVLAMALGFSHGHQQGLIDTITLPGFAVLIFLAGTREADGGRVWVASTRPMVYCGEISYAFYLVHPVALTVIGEQGWLEVHTAADAVLALGAGLALSIAFAAALHHTVERPARTLLMRTGRAKPPRRRHARPELPDLPWQVPSQRSWRPASGRMSPPG